MRGVNKVFLIGRVGQDPEVRSTRKGEPWCSFSIATNRNVRDGEGWSEETDWHDIKAFGRTAEVCSQYVGRGRVVAVEGSLRYRKWKDDEGRTRVKTSIVADRVEFLDKREASADPRPAPAPQAVPRAEPEELADIPF